MSELARPIFVGMGFYTAAYGAGLAGRGAITAASERARTEYRLDLANIPEGEQQKMSDEAQRLSVKYPQIDEQSVLELNKTTWALFGGDGDRARRLMEPVIRAFVADMTAVGVEQAGENLTSALKAMDSANRNEGLDGGVERIEAIFEGWARAKQVEGRDIDLGSLLEFAQKSKVAKYGLTDEFYSAYLPALGQDLGFGRLGDAMSGAYQNFVTPSAGGRQGLYIKRQEAMGLRTEDGGLLERDLFTTNPYEWVQTVLKPILEKNGVDTTNTGAVAEAVKKLMSNSNAAAMVTGWIEAQEQIQKNIDLYRGARGTSDAENARFRDPFAAAESLLAALRNLSAAIIPMETIAAGLTTLADGINRLAAAAKDNPLLTTLGIGAAGYGTYKGGKWLVDKASDAFGLKSSALALDGSAAALTRAALALQGAAGADVAGDLGGGKKPGGKGGVIAWATNPYALGAATAAYTFWPKPLNEGEDAAAEQQRASGGLFKNDAELWAATTPAEERKRLLDAVGGDENSPGAPQMGPAPRPVPITNVQRVDQAHALFEGDGSVNTRVDQAHAVFDTVELQAKAKAAGEELKNALSVTAKPNLDSSAIDAAIAKARQLLGLLSQVGAAAAQTDTDVGVEMRRNFSD